MIILQGLAEVTENTATQGQEYKAALQNCNICRGKDDLDLSCTDLGILVIFFQTWPPQRFQVTYCMQPKVHMGKY